MQSLVELAVVTVALVTPVQDLLDYVEYLPTAIRRHLFRELSNLRLRKMEVAWEAAAKLEAPEPRDGFDPLAGDKFLFDRETQRVWGLRMNAARLGCEPVSIENTVAAQGRRRNHRLEFWEHQFRTLLKLRTPMNHAGLTDILVEYRKLFVNVVEVLKVHGREVCEHNVELILALRQLRRLEVHHPEQQNTCWKTMRRLIQEHAHLKELGFFHGKLSDDQIARIRTMLVKPIPTLDKCLDTSRIMTLELVSVKIRLEGYLQLVGLVTEMPQLMQLRLSNSIADFDKKLLIDAAFRASKLQHLFLEHNEVEDDAFAGLAEMRKPLALRHLRLSDNEVSCTTVGAICSASMDGVLNLERLELTNNVQIGDPGIHALTPMLASPGAGPAAVLTHLDIRCCNFGLDGVTNLLLALGHNKTVEHLNIAQNFCDVGFGDVLADFLFTNDSVTHLQANGVGLGLAGVSARLLTALESNTTLISLSMGANRLRNEGASALLRALVKRAQMKPFMLVDLSGNLLTLSGLAMIADILENPPNANSTHSGSSRTDSIDTQDEVALLDRKRRRIDSSGKCYNSLSPQYNSGIPIEELCLLNNDFDGNNEQRGASSTLIESIQRRVGRLKSNEWAIQHQVYDDEV